MSVILSTNGSGLCLQAREAVERFVLNFDILLISAFGATELYESVNVGISLRSTLFLIIHH